MYAGSAFVLFDVANNVVEPMSLPGWLPTFIIWIALIGFPITVILSWIFDIAPERIDKPGFLKDMQEEQTPADIGKRRLKVGDVIIIVLIVVVGTLLYLRFFGPPKLTTMTIPVTIENEFGEKETKRIFKENNIYKIGLYQFANLSEATGYDWLSEGLIQPIYMDLNQFDFLRCTGALYGNTMKGQLSDCETLGLSHYITGEYNYSNETYEITFRIQNGINGKIENESTIRGKNLFSLIDTITYTIIRDIGVPQVIIDHYPDLPINEVFTNNPEAYQNYVK